MMIKPFYSKDGRTIYYNDCLEVLPQIPHDSVDLLCTDPPYGIYFMSREWDKGLANIQIWRECLRVLKAGAFAFIMCSPRQDVLSRQIINLQDAGFETGFTSIYWAYAEGFTKAKNIGNGSYAGFQPKPSVEIIIVAMKPLSEKTYTAQALKKGKGITWLDAGRIPTSEPISIHDAPKGTFAGGEIGRGSITNYRDNLDGRFPANLLVSDNALDDGRVRHSAPYSHQDKMPFPSKWDKTGKEEIKGYDDSGSFSRYYDLDKWWAKTFPFLIVSKPSKSEKNRYLDLPAETITGRDKGQDKRNVPQKARITPRKNQHPTVKPIKLMTYLVTIGSRAGDMVVDPFVGSGTTAVACQLINRRCIGIDNKEGYCAISVERLKQAVMPFE